MKSRWFAAPILLLAGCVIPLAVPSPEDLAASATGLKDAVRFETVGRPDDEPSPLAGTLSLDRAVRESLATDPGIQAALARVRQALAEARQARLVPNPILSVAFLYPSAGGRPTIEAGIEEEILSLVQRKGRTAAADDLLRAAASECLTEVLDALVTVQERYASAQALDGLMPVLTERRKLIDRLLEIAEARLKAGEGTSLDVTTLKTQKVELEVEIAERELERTEVRLELARLIGRPSHAADWVLETWSAPAAEERKESEWIVSALAHRPEIQSRMWEISALGREARLSRFGILEGLAAGGDAERDGGWSAGPSASIPLPLFDSGRARREGAEARVVEAIHLLTLDRRRVIEEVRRAHASFRAVVSTATRVEKELIPLLEERRRGEEAAYRAGQSDLISLILADQDLQEGKAKRIELQRRAVEALYRLHRAVGGPGRAPPKNTN